MRVRGGSCGCGLVRENGTERNVLTQAIRKLVLQPSVRAPVSADENRPPGGQRNQSIDSFMKDQETQQKFIELRTQGRTFARIAEELKVSPRTLIDWSRKFQFEIQNQRAIAAEALRERYLASREEEARQLGERLREVEAELATRKVADLSTPRLFTLAESLRRQLQHATGGELRLSIPVKDIPAAEYLEAAHDWTA